MSLLRSYMNVAPPGLKGNNLIGLEEFRSSGALIYFLYLIIKTAGTALWPSLSEGLMVSFP